VTSQDTVSRSVFIQVKHFLRRSGFKNIQILNNKLVFFCPSNPQSSLAFETAPFADSLHNLWIEQIKNLFVVDLEEAAEDIVMARWFSLFHFFDPLVKLLNSSLSDTDAFSILSAW